jgi:hypothetical protein
MGLLAVGRRAAHLVSYWIARKVNDPDTER